MLTASVVVSCYNQEKYIEECLDSILEQAINFDCEIIVSDDCSTDGTQDVLRAYSDKHKIRIKLFLRDKNVGAAVNYLEVHNIAQGDIVFHFDGDDIMLPGKLQKQYDVFFENPDVNIVFHKAVYFSDNGEYSSNTQFPVIADDEVLFFSLSDLACWGTIAVHSSYAYRRSSRKVRSLDREFMEWFFAMDSLMPAGSGAYLNTVYVKYRCNPSNGAYTSSKSGKIKAYTIYFDDLYLLFSENPFLRTDFYSNFIVTFFSMIRSTRSTTLRGVVFLLKNVIYFRRQKIIETITVRRKVGPGFRI